MFCQKCGNQLNEGAAFCPKCGSKVDAPLEPHAQGTSGNSVNQVKPQKRKSTLLIGIGIILYGLCCFLASTVLRPLFLVVWLIGLAEFICAIVNKKAVYVLSIIQTVAFTFTFILELFIRSSLVLLLLFSIAACALLLVGGIMFRKENAILGGSQ